MLLKRGKVPNQIMKKHIEPKSSQSSKYKKKVKKTFFYYTIHRDTQIKLAIPEQKKPKLNKMYNIVDRLCLGILVFTPGLY